MSDDVFDAETGEKLELLAHTPAVNRLESPSSTSPQKSPSQRQHSSPLPVVHPETQSLRFLGSNVDWQHQQDVKVEKADRCFRESLAGIRQELQRSDLTKTGRLDLTTELLEKTKRGYAKHVQALVVEELAREMNREVMLRLELAPLGRQRMQRRHGEERAFYRAQIARVKDECEMALTAAAAKNNLLR